MSVSRSGRNKLGVFQDILTSLASHVRKKPSVPEVEDKGLTLELPVNQEESLLEAEEEGAVSVSPLNDAQPVVLEETETLESVSEVVADKNVVTVEPVKDEVEWGLVSSLDDDASEHLPVIMQGVRAWLRPNGEKYNEKETKRSLHTLKGGAGTVGAFRLQGIFHVIEDWVQYDQRPPLESGLELLECAEALLLGLSEHENPVPYSLSAESLSLLPPSLAASFSQKPELQPPVVPPPFQETLIPVSVLLKPQPLPAPEIVPPRVVGELTKVSVEDIDAVSGLTESLETNNIEMLTGQGGLASALGKLAEKASGLSKVLRELELHAEFQEHQTKSESSSSLYGFSQLELDRGTRLKDLSHTASELAGDLLQVAWDMRSSVAYHSDRISRQEILLSDLSKSLAVIRQTRVEEVLRTRLTAAVSAAVRESGRHATLELEGGDLLVDRLLLEKLVAPLSHILRNSIAHGIEVPEERRRIGKPEVGKLCLNLALSPGYLHITVKDDGHGLDLPSITEKAIASELLPPNAPEVGVEKALSLICSPGFSTSTEVDTLSGRGIGMDVVLSSVLGQGGTLRAQSETGSGLTLSLDIPLTVSRISAILVRSAGWLWAVPMHLLVGVSLDKKPSRKDLPTLTSHMGVVPREEPSRKFLLRLQSSDEGHLIKEFAVDELVLVGTMHAMALGRIWSRVPGLLSAVTSPEGCSVFLINPLLFSSGERLQGVEAAKTQSVDAHSLRPKAILIVDDSLIARKHVQRVLKPKGFLLSDAADGRFAMDWLSAHQVDLLVLDLEMPGLDGFAVTRYVRSKEFISQHGRIPVVMVTSRTSPKHQEYALTLGVDAYLGKPVNPEALLREVNHLLG